MLDIIRTIILGLVEGISEWLPISSTGHLKLTGNFLKFDSTDITPGFNDMFEYVIQLGAILAVVVIFWNKIWPFTTKEKGYIKRKSVMIWSKVVVAAIPAVFAGLYLDDKVEAFVGEGKTEAMVISAALVFYGILFIIIELVNKNRKPKTISMKSLSYWDALLIGLFQVLAIIPGTSRSGATILGAIILGVSRTVAAEFSFFLAVPVIAGASLLKIVKFGFGFTGMEFVVLAVGMVTAFIVSVFAIKFLLGYIKKKDFKVFGYYRIVRGLLVLGYFSVFA